MPTMLIPRGVHVDEKVAPALDGGVEPDARALLSRWQYAIHFGWVGLAAVGADEPIASPWSQISCYHCGEGVGRNKANVVDQQQMGREK